MLRFSAAEPGRILAAGGDSFAFGSEAAVWHSPDEGPAWTEAYEGLQSRSLVQEIETRPGGADQDLVAVFDRDVAGLSGGILRSPDGGLSWSPVTTGVPAGLRWRALCPVAGEPLHLLAAHRDGTGQSGGLFETLDGGASWTSLSSPGAMMDVVCSPYDPLTVYAARTPGPLAAVSEDGGVLFAPIDKGLGSAGQSAPRFLRHRRPTRLFVSGAATALSHRHHRRVEPALACSGVLRRLRERQSECLVGGLTLRVWP